MKNKQFYNIDTILKEHADYNIIYGQRSNGKTFAALEYAVKRWVKYGEQAAYVRRFAEDMKDAAGASLTAGIVDAGVIQRETGGKYDRIYYYGRQWYLAKEDEKGKLVKANEPFLIGMALTRMEHDKGSSYPKITAVIFDEFISRNGELPGEFDLFLNVVSTIVRHRGNVKIFMLANTVRDESEYFDKMGIRGIIKKLKPGELRTIQTRAGLKIAIEYSDFQGKKESNKYFDFDSKTAGMITSGEWEIDSYPHAPGKHKKENIFYRFFIEYYDMILQVDMIRNEGNEYILIHRKKGDIKKPKTDRIYTDSPTPARNKQYGLKPGIDRVTDYILKALKENRVFYTTDDIGEILRNYLMAVAKNS